MFLVQVQFVTGTRYGLQGVEKSCTLKVVKFWGIISTPVENTGEKLVVLAF